VLRPYLKKQKQARSQWLTIVILATQKAEMRKIVVKANPGK
jgi:hypothetical protein